MPATFTWRGMVSTDATDPLNWSGGPPNTLPGQYDDLLFTSQPDPGPPPTMQSAPDCVGLAGTFASITITSEYTNTVTFGGAVTVDTYWMAGGAIAQPDSTRDLSVLNSFTWSGGTLNSSTVAANVNILGNGTIAPANAGTVVLGSTLNFFGDVSAPAETTIYPGTMALTAASGGLVVGAYYTLTARTQTQGEIIGITADQEGAKRVIIQENALLRLIGPGTYNNNIRFVNHGEFELRGEVQANLTGGGATNYSYYADGTSQTRIENGSVLTVAAQYGMGLLGQATLFLEMNPNLLASQQTATINGTFEFRGGTILFSAPIGIGTDPLVYGTFTINGDVYWEGGTYKPSVDYTTAGLANKWIINGKLTIPQQNTATITPNPQRGETPPANSVWAILDMQTKANDNKPTVTGGQLNLGEFDEGNRKVWKLAPAP